MKEERSLAASQCNKPQGMGASRRGVALSAAACGALALVLLALEGGTAYEMLLDLGREKYSVLEAQLWRQRGLTLEQQVAELQRLVDDHARKPGAGAAVVSARDALNITRGAAGQLRAARKQLARLRADKEAADAELAAARKELEGEEAALAAARREAERQEAELAEAEAEVKEAEDDTAEAEKGRAAALAEAAAAAAAKAEAERLRAEVDAARQAEAERRVELFDDMVAVMEENKKKLAAALAEPALAAAWNASLAGLPERGILVAAGYIGSLVNAWVNLYVLRHHLNCTLPIAVA